MALTGFLCSGLLGGPIAAAAELSLQHLDKPNPVDMKRVKGNEAHFPDQAASQRWQPKGAHWPKAGTAIGSVRGKDKDAASLRAGSLPVKLSRAKGKGLAQAQVQVLPRSVAEAVGVEGVLLAVRGYGTGKSEVNLTLDYSGFRDIYGGDWATRLTLRKLPACALTTPKKKSCGPGTPLQVHNDPVKDTLATSVQLASADADEAQVGSPVASSPMMRRSATRMAAAPGTVLLAAGAGESGPSGDFGATKLSPSGKWQAGGSSGGFSWSYALDTPSVPGGLGPDLSLSYSSQAVDGRTAATNNQANWVGDGWTLSPGFIERRYTPCEEDKDGGNNPSTKVGDLCWKEKNATLSLGGSSMELVGTDASGEWRKTGRRRHPHRTT